MDSMVMQKDDLESANEYFDLYMALRQALRDGKIEISDVDAYLKLQRVTAYSCTSMCIAFLSSKTVLAMYLETVSHFAIILRAYNSFSVK